MVYEIRTTKILNYYALKLSSDIINKIIRNAIAQLFKSNLSRAPLTLLVNSDNSLH